MKKLFKYLGISLASLLLITAIGLYIFYSMYKNWEGFCQCLRKKRHFPNARNLKSGI